MALYKDAFLQISRNFFSLQLYWKRDSNTYFLLDFEKFSACNFIKNKIPTQVFSCGFWDIFQTATLVQTRLRHRCFTANFEKYFSLHLHEKLDLSTGFFWWILRHSSSCIFIKNKIQVQVFSCKFWEMF